MAGLLAEDINKNTS